MRKTVIGKQGVDYVSKKSGQPVTGVSLHCTGESQNVKGLAVETIFISTKSPMYEQCMEMPLSSIVDVTYNRWGSVETVTPVTTK